MNLLPADEKRIRKQFDSFAKKVLRGEANKYLRDIAARTKHEITFSDLTRADMDKLSAVDEYTNGNAHFNVNGNEITVRGELLVMALKTLPIQNREVILMAYFLEMSDSKIAAMLKNNRKTIYRYRISGLDMLRSLLAEDFENG